MDDMMTRTPLTGKEGEALLFGLAIVMDEPDRVPDRAGDPLTALFSDGFTRDQIMAAGPRLHEFAFDDFIEEPLSDVEKAILRVCVENTTWLQPYIDTRPELLGIAKKTLRDLAAKLEPFGIEISHIPND